MNQIKILILDRNEMFRKGISKLLNEIPRINVIKDCESPKEAIFFIEEKKVDFLIMDFHEMEPTTFLKKIQSIKPDIKVIILTQELEISTVVEMVKTGVSSYLSKNSSVKELLQAIEVISTGDSYFPKKISSIVFKHLANPIPQHSKENNALTNREREILEYISKEFTNKEIASKLFISPRTVDTHRRNLLLKLDVKNTAGLVRYYYNVLNNSQRKAAYLIMLLSFFT